MHGIFRAVTPGTQNINPYGELPSKYCIHQNLRSNVCYARDLTRLAFHAGWTSISRTAYTRYPAQVQVELFEMCQPIVDR